MKKKKLILDTNIFRYLYYEDSIHKSSRNYLNRKLEDLFSEFWDEIYVPKIVQIELEYYFKGQNKNIWSLENLLSWFKLLEINEKSFYVLKAIEYTIKKIKKSNKYNLSDYMIIASIIAQFVDDLSKLDLQVSFLTADKNDFTKWFLELIFSKVEYENIWYVLWQEKFLETKRYNTINIFKINLIWLNKNFIEILI